MIELKFRLILACVLWVHSSDRALGSNDFHAPKSNRVLDECKRLCRHPKPTEVPLEDSQSRHPCVEKCLLLAQENSSSTTRPTTEPLSVITASTTDPPKFGCPRDYGPTAGEFIPGDVTNVAVAFVEQKTENSQEWVARVNWTAPKDVNVSSNWRGYLAIWFSESLTTDNGMPGLANCRALPKNELHLDINETDGWKYPNRLYITIVALPSERETFTMDAYDPRAKDWGPHGRYAPTITLKGHKRFALKSGEGIVLLIVVGILLGLAMVWIIHVSGVKRKHFTTYNLALAVDKKAGMKADEMKDQLIA